MSKIQPGDVFVKRRADRDMILLMLPRTERSGKQPYVRLSTREHNTDSAYWTDRERVGSFSGNKRYEYVGTIPPEYMDILIRQEVKHKYTVIIADYSQSFAAPTTRAVKVTGHSPEDAAGDAEVVVAGRIFEREYGDHDPTSGGWDDEWIKCMEAAGTLAVIEGHPKVYIEDAIYETIKETK